MKLLASFFIAIGTIHVAESVRSEENFVKSANDTRAYLLQFHANPKQVMNTPLPHFDSKGSQLKRSSQSREQVLEQKILMRKNACRTSGVQCESFWRVSSWPVLWQGFNDSNQIASFLYSDRYMKSLLEMEQAGLLRLNLEELPWSDSFWPQQKGLIARRWNDSSFPNSSDWSINYLYTMGLPPATIDAEAMAPSEKYDLLVGDEGFRLTEKMWGEGKYWVDRGRRVPAWAGICHGWAPAAIMSLNPKRAVTVISPAGTRIKFYPSDIKALASLSWGYAAPVFKQVGRRCFTRSPAEDPVGRVPDSDCFDVNPGTWHMAIVNQMGVEKRSFVFDATYDDQVWNYPLAGYQYHYFNPQTLAVSSSFAGSAVKLSEFTIDKFRSYRSPETKYVVGIAMDVSYSVPTAPRTKPVSKPSIHTVKYVYDLELDAEGKIIGGEWYSNWHPDFIWNPPPQAEPYSTVEKNAMAPLYWSGDEPVSQAIQEAAVLASPEGQPLYVVVKRLLELSQ